MPRQGVRVGLTALLLLMLVAGCRTAAVYQPADVALQPAARAIDDAGVRDAIVAGGTAQGWDMSPQDRGWIVATYQKGVHQAVVDITYTATGYGLKYRSSENLKYDGSRIHRAYNQWVGALETAINGRLTAAGLLPDTAPVAAAATSTAATPATARPSAVSAAPAKAVAADGAFAQVAASEIKGIRFGQYHALVIGLDNYQYLPPLHTAVADARAIEQLLRTDYGFSTRLLLNASRDQIMEALDQAIGRIGASDNLLIYYAGHGWKDDRNERGYWLPVDARVDQRSRWLSNAEVSDTLKSVKAKHVLVVADSCYGATLTRSANLGVRDADYLKRIVGKRARLVMTSGGLEPVADTGGDGHSPFANALLHSLRQNPLIIDGTKLFAEIREQVAGSTSQTPEYAAVREAGHDGGDFLFYRKR